MQVLGLRAPQSQRDRVRGRSGFLPLPGGEREENAARSEPNAAADFAALTGESAAPINPRSFEEPL